MHGIRTASLTALCAALSASLCSQPADARPADSCVAAFHEALAEGRIDSVNGLAIEQGFAGFFYTTFDDGRARIVHRRCDGGRLGDARPVFSANGYSDYQPTLSLDGERLYFTSTRPIEGDEAARQNVWSASKAKDWQDAAAVPALVSPYWDGHAIDIGRQTILFASERPDDGQMVDIYEFDLAGEGAGPVRVSSLNSGITDNDMAFDRHSKALVFSRYDPETEDIDLYVSFLTADGWLPPVRLAQWSTPDWDMSPAFTPDGEYLLYKTGNDPFRAVPMSEVIASVRKSAAQQDDEVP